ncbi:hypothetical protein Hanom_Chr15g01337781 [Helianthus anomalus]
MLGFSQTQNKTKQWRESPKLGTGSLGLNNEPETATALSQNPDRTENTEQILTKHIQTNKTAAQLGPLQNKNPNQQNNNMNRSKKPTPRTTN